jgi:superfamily II DNA or RNA helicase
MRVLHGLWTDGGLCVWAEDSALPPRAPLSPRAARPPDSGEEPAPHPFAVSEAELADLLEPFTDLARKADGRELTLRLPTRARMPLASPELVPDPATASASGKTVLAAWGVPALLFEPSAALSLLAELDSVAAEDPGFAAGASIPYLSAVARFAASLAERGRVLPVLSGPMAPSARSSEADGANGMLGYRARWRPVLAGADAQRAHDLAVAMPPVGRAATGENPGQILARAVAALADAAARSRLPSSLLPPRRGRTPARIPLAERYVVALTTTDARVRVETPTDQSEAEALAAQLAGWLDSARMPTGPVRTCFRLIEPDGAPDDDPWRVEFSLQSTEDPSLMLPAADVWAGSAGLGRAGAGGAGAGGAGSGGSDPVEQLLAGLGGAARLFPELAGALREVAPCELALDTAGAFGFLKQTGPLLAGAGFGVLLPDWVRKARLGLKLTTKSKSAGTSPVTTSMFGMRDLVDFRYDLAVGDESLDPAELAELARRKIPLVRLRGQWVELDEAHLTAALRFLERNPPGQMSAGDALAAGLGLVQPADAPPVTVNADGWLGDLLSGEADRRLRPVSAPPGFTGTLRPYQERGLAWLSFLGELGLGGILADDMGLGKTIQLLSLIAAARSRPPQAGIASSPAGPTLLVCPMSLVGNWQREAAKFTPDLCVHVHHGADRLDGEELTAVLAGADLVITTYGVAARDRAALAEISWARVVCDEAQTIKNHATRQAQAVRALPAATRIALTGTPVENRLADLWSIMDFTNPGLLGSAAAFRKRYAIPVERHADADAVESLRKLTSPFCLRRLKTDKTIISDLPDKQEMKVWCNLTAEQASLYQATVDDMLSQIESADAELGEQSISRRGLVLATMAKLKQVCNHPAHLLGDGSRLPGRSGKLERLEEICDEIVAEGDKALCFTQYAEFGAMLRPHLAARLGCPVLFLHGGTSKKQRDAMVAEFGELDEPALFLLSLKAGGTGLNLTAASHVIHVDRWWNPAVEDQATDRAFRIGQRKNVQVRKFVCVGTLEERIDAMIEQKKALAEKIVGTGESWLTELSVADLRAVLELSPEAVSS